MPCQSELNWVNGLLVTVHFLIAGIIAAAVATIALSGFWVTAIFGAAETASLICTGLVIALETTLAGLGAALVLYDQCMGRHCPDGYNRLLVALSATFLAPWATIWVNVNLANATALIPGAAIPPMIVLIASLVGMTASLIAFDVLWAQFQVCAEEGRRVAMPIRDRGSGGSSGGGGRGSGGGPRIGSVRGPNLLAALNAGHWFRKWPSGTIIDGNLGPDVCPICLYTIVVGGTVTNLETGDGGKLSSINISQGQLLTFDSSGALALLPVCTVAREPDGGYPVEIIQGVVTDGGKIRAVIGGSSQFDFSPYLMPGGSE
jgi:hypothetical protein